ncbi:MAG: chromate efflux transporter [Polyangia bacterium]
MRWSPTRRPDLTEEPASERQPRAPHALRDVASFFLRLGFTTFGGPAAHIAMMEEEIVRRRGWLKKDEFLDLLGATNLIPGPNSTEMAIFIGYKRAGWPGLVLGGLCFILPAALITLGLAMAYVRLGSVPEVGALLYGVKPIIMAIIVQALWGLGRTAVKSQMLGVLAVLAVVASFAGLNALVILLGAGLLAMAASGRLKTREEGLHGIFGPGVSFLGATSAAAAGVAAPVSLAGLFLVFLKVGAVLYGSGYVLLAFLRTDLVEHWHWLTESQLLDAVAVGQVTPGPVFTTATFIGYVLHGRMGALLATVGIFLPSFVFVAVSSRVVPYLRRTRAAGAFLDGVNVASLALMVTVTWFLGCSAIVDLITVSLGTMAALLLFRYRINSAWLVLAGGLIGVGRWWLQ